jgi:hypothetical protein
MWDQPRIRIAAGPSLKKWLLQKDRAALIRGNDPLPLIAHYYLESVN